MKNLFTKLLSLAIVLCILTALVPMAHAEFYIYERDGFEYSLLPDGEIQILRYTGDDTTVIIPESINGTTVRSVSGIDPNPNYTITKLVIPSTVYDLSMAVYYLDSLRALEEIEVSEDNEVYSSVDGVLYSKDGTELLYYPLGKEGSPPGGVGICGDYKYRINDDGTAEIMLYLGSDAFLIIPSELDGYEVTEIHSNADFDSARYVSIPEGVTEVDLYNFNNARTVRIPSTAKDVLEAYVSSDMAIILPVGERDIYGIAPMFSDYVGIKTVYYEGTEEQFASDIRFKRNPTPDSVSSASSFLRDGRTAYYSCAPADKFTDVSEDAWYYDYLYYATIESLLQGVGEDIFAPNADMTRAMVVTVLWRLAGEPEAGASTFTDLTQDWYKTAVAWAAENSIVLGKSETEFAPDEAVTREQLATMLHRYAEFMEYDTTAAGDLAAFHDAADTSDWAEEALTWANGAGLINGTARADGNYLDPRGNATRAQVAKILAVFHGEYVTEK